MRIPEEFNDIRPYEPEEMKQAFDDLLNDRQFQVLLNGFVPWLPKSLRNGLLRLAFIGVKTPLDFQLRFMKPIVRYLIRKHTDGCTFDNRLLSTVNQRYTFVSNHRDIVLDSAFLDVKLVEAGYPTTVEIGIESTLDRTLQLINRHHTFKCASDCINDLYQRGIDTGAHLILGLPGETEQDWMTHADRVSALPIKTLKLHQLQVVKGTALARMYEQVPSSIRLFETPQEYAAVVSAFIKRARPDLCYDRFVSETPKNMLIAPAWGIKPHSFNQMIQLEAGPF